MTAGMVSRPTSRRVCPHTNVWFVCPLLLCGASKGLPNTRRSSLPGVNGPLVLGLRRGVAVALFAVCCQHRAQHRFSPKLRDPSFRAPDGSCPSWRGPPIWLGASYCVDVGLVRRCGAVLCCGRLGTPVLCRVVLCSAWYAGVMPCGVVVGLVRPCCAVLCRIALFVLS